MFISDINLVASEGCGSHCFDRRQSPSHPFQAACHITLEAEVLV